MNSKSITYGAIAVTVTLLAGGLVLQLLAQQNSIIATGDTELLLPLSRNVGRTGSSGSFTFAAGVYDVQGCGADIWGGADAFHFVYRPWNGNAEIVARVVSVEKTDPWAKAGIMIRGDLTETSPHVMVAVTSEKGVTYIRRTQPSASSRDDAHQAMRMIRKDRTVLFQQRGSGGAEKASDSLLSLPSPRWIKLVRQGKRLTAYDSSDGIAWEWLGTETIALPAQCYIGLAVSSHDVSRLCRARLDQVEIGVPSASAMPAAKLGTGDGLNGTYYSRMNFTGSSVQRVDSAISFDWGYGSPVERVGRNEFSVRWEGELEAQFSEPYAISVVSDDRARLWLNGELLIDEWYEHGEQTSTGVVNLEAGKRYLLRIDYFENRGRAVAKLLWSSPSTPQQVIPQSQLYSRVTDSDQDDLPDVWELANGFKPNDPNDGKDAPDGQKNANRKKFENGFEAENARVQVARLAEQWFSQDVGPVGPTGSALVLNGIWKLTGSGADI